jgi:RNA recognition motif-containing protein
MSIYIGNLAYEADDKVLTEHVSAHAPVRHAIVVRDKESGKSKGFAFVTLELEDDEERVIEALEGSDFMGRNLRVIRAHSRTLRMP